jgi:hypothetical protein
MLSLQDIQGIVADVHYRDWDFQATESSGRIYLQIAFLRSRLDSEHDDRPENELTRKWLLSPFMTKGEIVQTCLKAVLTAEEHEARERFTYKDLKVFSPHFDLDLLVQAAEQKAVEQRQRVAQLEG